MARKAGMRKGEMTPAHKSALADGRGQAKAVREYLAYLKDHPVKRGRKRSADGIQKELDTVKAKLAMGGLSPVEELKAIQAQIRLADELFNATGKDALRDELEKAFIKVASNFSLRHGISRAAWAAMGVQPHVLKAAGIK